MSLPSVLMRNSLTNFFSQALLIVVAIWAIPLLALGLQGEGFGLLSLLWAFVGYFSLLDFGTSRAITKFVAESIATNDTAKIRRITRASLAMSAGIGLITCTALILSTPYLVTSVLKIHPANTIVATDAFVIAAAGIPFTLTFGTLKGLQMAHQRFDLVNFFQGGIGLCQWVGSVLVLWLGGGLREIILMTVLVRIVAAVGSFALLPKLIPNVFAERPLWDSATVKELVSFGGWVTVSQVVSPLFLYADRVLIGTFISMTAVAYYVVPQEALTRLSFIPMSVTTTLFPAMSQESAAHQSQSRLDALYFRTTKYLVYALIPIVLVLFAFAQEILTVWVGPDFALNSTHVFQILVAGLLFNMVAQVPVTALHALGRPDLSAKFHLAELPLMLALNFILIPLFGIVGTAIVWSVRAAVDAALLFLAVNRVRGHSFDTTRNLRTVHAILLQLAIGCAGAAVLGLVEDLHVRLFLMVLFVVGNGVCVWRYGLDDVDKKFFFQFPKAFLIR